MKKLRLSRIRTVGIMATHVSKNNVKWFYYVFIYARKEHLFIFHSQLY